MDNQQSYHSELLEEDNEIEKILANVPDFIKKLYRILEKDAYKSVIHWLDDGKSFLVLDQANFSNLVLPRHFKHKNFSTFNRQLNKYGFRKVKNTFSTKKYGDTACEFHHNYFQRNSPNLLQKIKRQQISKARAPNPSEEPRNSNAPTIADPQTSTLPLNTSNSSNNHPQNPPQQENAELQSQLHKISNENTQVVSILKQIAEQYQFITSEITNIKKTVNAQDELISNLVVKKPPSPITHPTTPLFNNIIPQTLHNSQSSTISNQTLPTRSPNIPERHPFNNNAQPPQPELLNSNYPQNSMITNQILPTESPTIPKRHPFHSNSEPPQSEMLNSNYPQDSNIMLQNHQTNVISNQILPTKSPTVPKRHLFHNNVQPSQPELLNSNYPQNSMTTNQMLSTRSPNITKRYPFHNNAQPPQPEMINSNYHQNTMVSNQILPTESPTITKRHPFHSSTQPPQSEILNSNYPQNSNIMLQNHQASVISNQKLLSEPPNIPKRHPFHNSAQSAQPEMISNDYTQNGNIMLQNPQNNIITNQVLPTRSPRIPKRHPFHSDTEPPQSEILNSDYLQSGTNINTQTATPDTVSDFGINLHSNVGLDENRFYNAKNQHAVNTNSNPTTNTIYNHIGSPALGNNTLNHSLFTCIGTTQDIPVIIDDDVHENSIVDIDQDSASDGNSSDTSNKSMVSLNNYHATTSSPNADANDDYTEEAQAIPSTQQEILNSKQETLSKQTFISYLGYNSQEFQKSQNYLGSSSDMSIVYENKMSMMNIKSLAKPTRPRADQSDSRLAIFFKKSKSLQQKALQKREPSVDLEKTWTDPRSLGWAKAPRILLVEDGEVDRVIAIKILEMFGCKIELALDGNVAVSKMNNGEFDIVLMDIIMPNLDGVLATTFIRSFDRSTPIISVTSTTGAKNCTTYFNRGINEVLEKPLTKGRVKKLLNRYCARLNMENLGYNKIISNPHFDMFNNSYGFIEPAKIREISDEEAANSAILQEINPNTIYEENFVPQALFDQSIGKTPDIFIFPQDSKGEKKSGNTQNKKGKPAQQQTDNIQPGSSKIVEIDKNGNVANDSFTPQTIKSHAQSAPKKRKEEKIDPFSKFISEFTRTHNQKRARIKEVVEFNEGTPVLSTQQSTEGS
ncbi:hypothetical protein BB558_000867 [Smittium angustum]|uniref:Response regulatory domain-containing protein n=1 Tax=Smittium angustum TaxID=133377 RepID=A0A2U1JCY6_SMIAN|nr:hypothetical protein BB558_000867 [Smittium angustum]